MSRDDLHEALRAEIAHHDRLTRNCADLQSALDIMNELQDAERERLGGMTYEEQAARADYFGDSRREK